MDVIVRDRKRGDNAVAQCMHQAQYVVQYRNILGTYAEKLQNFMCKQQGKLKAESAKVVELTIEQKALQGEIHCLKGQVKVLEKGTSEQRNSKSSELGTVIKEHSSQIKALKKEKTEAMKELKKEHDSAMKSALKAKEDALKVKDDEMKYRVKTEKEAIAQRDKLFGKRKKEISELNKTITSLKNSNSKLEEKFDRERKHTMKLMEEKSKLMSQSDTADPKRRKSDTFNERLALEDQRSTNRLMEHAAKASMTSFANQQK